MKLKIILGLALMIITLGARSQTSRQAPSLTIGDAAPELAVAKWLKGTPVQQFEKGRIYVIEFWATWCAPCIAAMPHVSELARQYKEQATFIGVSVWERTSEKIPDPATIQKFVNEKDSIMDYNVAMDDPLKARVSDSWLKAAGIGGIPATFVIDTKGKVAWIGHPDKLGDVLKEMVLSPDRSNYEQTRNKFNEDMRVQEMMQAFKSVLGYGMAKNYGMAFHETRKQIEKDPSFETRNFWVTVQAYLNFNGSTALTYIKEKSVDTAFLKVMGKNDIEKGRQEVELTFATVAARQPGIDLSVYYEAVERLKKEVRKPSASSELWSALAQGYAYLNEPVKAITAQQKSMEVYQKESKTDPAIKEAHRENTNKRMEEKLAEFKALKKKKETL